MFCYSDSAILFVAIPFVYLQEHIEFGVNLDVTAYRDGKRETLNPPGRAYRPVVWDHYQVTQCYNVRGQGVMNVRGHGVIMLGVKVL